MDQQQQYVIYKHTNKINNKVYIGQTCRKPQYRWGLEGKGYKENLHFFNAIQKYGWNNFQHKILYTNLSKKEANQKQQELIHLYNSTDPEKGYNHTRGGQIGSISRQHSVICIETNKTYNTLAKAALDYKTSDSHIYEAAKGIRLTAGGKHWIFLEDDTEEKRQQKLFKKPNRKNNTNVPIRVKCLQQPNKVFNSLVEAAKWCNLKTVASISLQLSGKQKTAGKHPDTKQPLVWERI